jgi:membrane associated rhomboid family serine protease
MYDRIPQAPIFAEPVRLSRPIAWVTWTLLGTTIAVYLFQLLGNFLLGDDIVGDTLAFSPQALAESRYWTLLTYAWAHAVPMPGTPSFFWLHIVLNMVPLVCLGPALEEMLGDLRFLGLYIGAAIFSALVWYVFNLHTDDPIIGASGAIFGIIAGIGTAIPEAKVTVLLFYIIPLRMSMGVLAIVACVIEAASIVFHWMPEVAHSAHLGGAAFGFIYVAAVRMFSPKKAYLTD